MRTLAALTTVVLVALAVATAAGAAQNSATTDLLNPPPTSGATLNVRFTVFGGTPVVPFEYALENVCITPDAKRGGFTVGQHDPIIYWTDEDAQGDPQVTMPVYLQSIPTGSSCKVSLVKNNVAVKGSTVAYTVS